MSQGGKDHRRVSRGNADKLLTNDDDSDYSMCTLYTVIKGLFNDYRKRTPNYFFQWDAYVCVPWENLEGCPMKREFLSLWLLTGREEMCNV